MYLGLMHEDYENALENRMQLPDGKRSEQHREEWKLGLTQFIA